jgi:hypothetical protein
VECESVSGRVIRSEGLSQLILLNPNQRRLHHGALKVRPASPRHELLTFVLEGFQPTARFVEDYPYGVGATFQVEIRQLAGLPGLAESSELRLVAGGDYFWRLPV